MSLSHTEDTEGAEPTPTQRHSMPVYTTGMESPWACYRIVDLSRTEDAEDAEPPAPTSLHGRDSERAISYGALLTFWLYYVNALPSDYPMARHGDSTRRLPPQPAWNDVGGGGTQRARRIPTPNVIAWARQRTCNLLRCTTDHLARARLAYKRNLPRLYEIPPTGIVRGEYILRPTAIQAYTISTNHVPHDIASPRIVYHGR